jgi:riboflavin kinase/FMN adenylyltransferase
MQHVQNLEKIPPTERPVVLAMGCFDGVHTGHQKVISTAVAQANSRNGEAWVFTFSPHPAKVLSPETAPPIISAPQDRLRQLEALGVYGIIEIPFDHHYAHIEPESFLSNLRKAIPTLSGIVCGRDWSFGRRAGGNFQTLESFCKTHGITATAVPPVLYHGERISSTHIRKAVQTGNIPLAEKMLGRPFALFGTVVEGRGVGRSLGFPTANIVPDNGLIPASGVYAAFTRVESQKSKAKSPDIDSRPPLDTRHSTLRPSAVFIGERKTFNDPESVIEVYLLDFNGDLYGQPLEVCLVKKLRDIQRFPSRETLVEQIKKDIANVKQVLNEVP